MEVGELPPFLLLSLTHSLTLSDLHGFKRIVKTGDGGHGSQGKERKKGRG